MRKASSSLSELRQILQTELDIKKKNHLIKKQNRIMKQLLSRLAFQIFLLVADADSNIDPKEVAKFREFLKDREGHCTNNYTRRIFHSTIINYSNLLGHYQSGRIKKDMAQVTKTMAYIELCVTPKTMSAICCDLEELAIAIAQASGGLLGLRKPISREEEAVVNQLKAIFQKSIQKAKGQDPKTRAVFEFFDS